MKAKDIRDLPLIDESDVAARRFNDLLRVVQEQAERIERLERRSGRCECMNCIVIGV